MRSTRRGELFSAMEKVGDEALAFARVRIFFFAIINWLRIVAECVEGSGETGME